MNEPIGHRRWAIAEGYIPGWSSGPEPQFTSHETACLLNASDKDAHVEITAFFSDREPTGPYRLTVLARRTLHVRDRKSTRLNSSHVAISYAVFCLKKKKKKHKNKKKKTKKTNNTN